MRHGFTLVLMLLPLAAALGATPDQGKVFTPAPVPSLATPGLPPAERAGGPGLQSSNAGPPDATPFSSAPSGTLKQGDQADVHTREASPGSAVTTPNLSR